MNIKRIGLLGSNFINKNTTGGGTNTSNFAKFAQNLVGRDESVYHEFITPRPSGEHSIEDGIATITKIQGCCIPWSQLNDDPYFENKNKWIPFMYSEAGVPFDEPVSIITLKNKKLHLKETSFPDESYESNKPGIHRILFKVEIPILADVAYGLDILFNTTILKDISFDLTIVEGDSFAPLAECNNRHTSFDTSTRCQMEFSTTNNLNKIGFIFVFHDEYDGLLEVIIDEFLLHDISYLRKMNAQTQVNGVHWRDMKYLIQNYRDYTTNTLITFKGGILKSIGFNILSLDNRKTHILSEPLTHIPPEYLTTNNICLGVITNEFQYDSNILFYQTISEHDIIYINLTCKQGHGAVIPLDCMPKHTYRYSVHGYSFAEYGIAIYNKTTGNEVSITRGNNLEFIIDEGEIACFYVFNVNSNAIDTVKTVNVYGPKVHLLHSGYKNEYYADYIDNRCIIPDITKIKDINGEIIFPNGLCYSSIITQTEAFKADDIIILNPNDSLTKDYFICPVFPNNDNDLNIYDLDSLNPGEGVGIIVTENSGFIVANAPTAKLILSFSGIEEEFIFDDKYYYALLIDGNPLTDKPVIGRILYPYPKTYTLAEPLILNYEVWDFGTEIFTSDKVSSFLAAYVKYGFNAVDRIRENSTHIKEIKEITDNIQNNVYIGSNVSITANDGIQLGTNFVIKPNLILSLSNETMRITPNEIQLGDNTNGINISNNHGIKLGNNVNIGTDVYIESGFDSRNLTLGSGSGTGNEWFTENIYGGLECASKNIYLGSNIHIGSKTNVIIGKNDVTIDIQKNKEQIYLGSNVYIDQLSGISLGTASDQTLYIGTGVIIPRGLQFEIKYTGDSGNPVQYLVIKNTDGKKCVEIALNKSL